MGEPKVYSRGLVLSPTETKAGFLEVVTQITREAIEKSPHNPQNIFISAKDKKAGKVAKLEIDKVQIDLGSELHRYIDDRMHRHPLLEVILMEYTGKAGALVIGA
jgi:hypothetical protein